MRGLQRNSRHGRLLMLGSVPTRGVDTATPAECQSRKTARRLLGRSTTRLAPEARGRATRPRTRQDSPASRPAAGAGPLPWRCVRAPPSVADSLGRGTACGDTARRAPPRDGPLPASPPSRRQLSGVAAAPPPRRRLPPSSIQRSASTCLGEAHGGRGRTRAVGYAVPVSGSVLMPRHRCRDRTEADELGQIVGRLQGRSAIRAQIADLFGGIRPAVQAGPAGNALEVGHEARFRSVSRP